MILRMFLAGVPLRVTRSFATSTTITSVLTYDPTIVSLAPVGTCSMAGDDPSAVQVIVNFGSARTLPPTVNGPMVPEAVRPVSVSVCSFASSSSRGVARSSTAR